MAQLVFRPSDAHRWMACSGALQYQQRLKLGGDVPSDFANEGIAAHRFAEKLLNNGEYPEKDLSLDEIKDLSIMYDYVMEYVNYVQGLKGLHFYEELVSFDKIIPNGKGTCDALVVNGDELHVVDLKYGAGIKVYAYNNPQLLLYALGAYLQYNPLCDFKTIHLTIVQPRMDHISEYTLSVAELDVFAHDVRYAYELAMLKEPELKPGVKQCQFCAVRPQCSAVAEKVRQTLTLKATDNGISDEVITNAITHKPLISGWFTALEDHAKGRLQAGDDIKGLKLIEGRANRKWVDEEKAGEMLLELLSQDAYTLKYLSVAQAEKKIAKDERDVLKPHIYKPKGKLTVVPIEARGDAKNISKMNFDDLTERIDKIKL